MTIIDPRHPLSGLTFPLVEISNKPYLGLCCVIWVQGRVERNVPLSATDRATEPLSISPFPLNLAAVQQLLATYQKIQGQLTGRTADEVSNPIDQLKRERDQPGPSSDPAQGGLVSDDANPATNCVSDLGSHVSPFAPEGQPDQADGGLR